MTADWTTLHSLGNKDLRSAYTASEFASRSEAEALRVGRIVALRRLTVSEPRSDDSGARWVVVTYAVRTRSSAGTMSETLYDAFFISEMRDWKLWYTAAR